MKTIHTVSSIICILSAVKIAMREELNDILRKDCLCGNESFEYRVPIFLFFF